MNGATMSDNAYDASALIHAPGRLFVVGRFDFIAGGGIAHETYDQFWIVEGVVDALPQLRFTHSSRSKDNAAANCAGSSGPP
jgi:hypothetical protein